MSDVGVDNVRVPAGGQPPAESPAQDPPHQHAWSELLEETPYDNSLSSTQERKQWHRHNGNGRKHQPELPPVQGMVVEELYSGIVDEVTSGVVYVTLRDARSGEEEFTSFDLSQLGAAAAPKAVPGAQFTWSIGHLDADEHRIGVSIIELLDPYKPTSDELQAARDAGAEAADRLVAGESSRTDFG